MSFDEKKIRLLAFDCDGTLLFTIPDYLYSMNKTMEHYSLPSITEEEAMSFLGNGTDHFLSCSLRGKLTERFDEIKEYYLSVYHEHCYVDTKPYPGVEEMLNRASKKGFKLAIMSNKPDFILNKLIRNAFPNIHFDFVGGQQGKTKKPDPYLMNKALAELSLTPDQAAYFGDTEVDAEFASRASVKNLFIVTYGYRNKEILYETTKPESFFDNIDDIIDFFKL